MTRIKASLALASVILIVALGPSAMAHTLGIDPAKLLEAPDGRYALVAEVPPHLAPAIRTPILPERCAFEGSPRGKRGRGEVRYDFICETPLTAADRLTLPWQREGVVLKVSWADGTTVSRLLNREGGAIIVDLASFQAGSGSLFDAAERYLALGVEHILLGVDHLLFVFGLLLLVRGIGMMVKTITAFTVAHSLTLGLATLGLVQAPIRPIEAAIALSIIFIAVEIVHAGQGRLGLAARFPWVVAFAFGLLHGFGFAGALSAVGLPPKEIPLALLFFNIGVELGQLAFVFVVLAAAEGLRRMPLARPRWGTAALAYAIGTAATYWFMERALLILPA